MINETEMEHEDYLFEKMVVDALNRIILSETANGILRALEQRHEAENKIMAVTFHEGERVKVEIKRDKAHDFFEGYVYGVNTSHVKVSQDYGKFHGRFESFPIRSRHVNVYHV